MSIRKRFDWKTFLTLFLTFASVIVPVLIWQLDFSAKALTLSVKAVSELQQPKSDGLDGIEVLVDGKQLDSVYLSVLEIVNSGSKPIVTTDFEGAIRITAANQVAISKAKIIQTKPSDLNPGFVVRDGAIQIQPLLLNKGDSIEMTVVTAGGRPEFHASARIAGVSNIERINVQEGRISRLFWIDRTVATLLLSIYIMAVFDFASGLLGRSKKDYGSLFVALVCAFGAAVIMSKNSPIPASSSSSMVEIFPYAIVASVIAVVARFVKARRKEGSPTHGLGYLDD